MKFRENISNRINLKTDEATKTAEINISGVIGFPASWQFENAEDIISAKEEMSNEIKAFENLQSEGFKTIKLNIDSPGGSVDHAVSMKRALEKSGALIIVEYTGNSASAATILATAAKRENISISSYIDILVHESRIGAVSGTKKDFDFASEILQKTNETLINIYKEHTGQSDEIIRNLISRNSGEGTLLTASEALEFGFVGSIINEQKFQVAAIDSTLLNRCGWSNNQINNLKTKNQMSIFTRKAKTGGKVKLFENETVSFAYSEIKEGVQIFAESEISGAFEIGNKKVEIENSKIVRVSELTPEESTLIEDRFAALESRLSEIETKLSEMAPVIEETASDLDEVVEAIRKIGSPNPIEKTEIKEKEDFKSKISAAAKSRERLRMKNSKK